MKDFRNLKVWEKNHHLTLEVYRISEKFPKEEMYGLRSQIRRSYSSIPTNISEGCGRDSEAELTRFLRIAMGSASELEYLLLLSNHLDMIGDPDYEVLSNDTVEIKKMLTSLIRSIKDS